MKNTSHKPVQESIRVRVMPIFIDTCLWSSCRYFIGRKSIAATMHASEMAQFIKDNPKIYDSQRREWMAQDVRKEINRVLSCDPYIRITGHNDHIDAFSIWGHFMDDYLKRNGLYLCEDKDTPENGFNPRWYLWDINLETEEVSMVRADVYNNGGFSWMGNIQTLVPWIKLAGYLDPTHKAKINTAPASFKPKYKTVQGFFYPSYGRIVNEKLPRFYMALTEDKQYIREPHMDVSIIPDCIVSTIKNY